MYYLYQQLPGSAEAALMATLEDEAQATALAQDAFDQDGRMVTVEHSAGGVSRTVLTLGLPAVVDPLMPPAVVVPSDAKAYADFLRLFTLPERVAIRTAALTDMVISDYMDLARAQGYVKLGSAEAQMGIGYLAQQGHISPERMAEILGI